MRPPPRAPRTLRNHTPSHLAPRLRCAPDMKHPLATLLALSLVAPTVATADDAFDDDDPFAEDDPFADLEDLPAPPKVETKSDGRSRMAGVIGELERLAAGHLLGFSDVAVIEADDAEAARGELAAEIVVPQDHLGAEPHDQEHRLGIGVAKNLVTDVDAVGADDLRRLVVG